MYYHTPNTLCKKNVHLKSYLTRWINLKVFMFIIRPWVLLYTFICCYIDQTALALPWVRPSSIVGRFSILIPFPSITLSPHIEGVDYLRVKSFDLHFLKLLATLITPSHDHCSHKLILECLHRISLPDDFQHPHRKWFVIQHLQLHHSITNLFHGELIRLLHSSLSIFSLQNPKKICNCLNFLYCTDFDNVIIHKFRMNINLANGLQTFHIILVLLVFWSIIFYYIPSFNFFCNFPNIALQSRLEP